MGRSFHAMRITTDEPATDGPRLVLAGGAEAPMVPVMAAVAGTPDSLEQKFDDVQREMDSLRAELNQLRRRDETLNFYMQRIDEELRLAARLQQDFLPKTLPQLGPIRFHTLYRPAGYVSGDLYDVMRLDERHLGFYIADAVGHGMPAALLTMFIKHALVTKEIRPGGYRLLNPSEALARLNESLVEQNLAHATFATALYGMIDIHTLELTMACAGHPTPLLLHESGAPESLQVEGSLLGIFPGETYVDFTTRLLPGDRLVLYTDGIELAFCKDSAIGDTDRWREELLSRRHLSSDTILAEFADIADKESGSLEPKDDLTMVMIDVGRE